MLLHTTVTQCPSLRDAVTYQDVLNVAITNAVVTVGNALLENRALPLPSIYSVFIQERTTLFNAKGVREPQEHTTLSSRWLQSELVGRLQHHMVYTCKVRKYGTLLYRPSSDIVMLLTEAMWKLRNTEQAEGEKEEEKQADCTTAHSTNQLDASNINKLLHLQIQTFVAEDGQVPYEHDNLNINALMHPKLWEAICLLTKSKRESIGGVQQWMMKRHLQTTLKSYVGFSCCVQCCLLQMIAVLCQCTH